MSANPSTTNPFEIRRATPADLAELIKQALFLAREDSVQPVSEARVEEIVFRCCHQNQALAGVMESPRGEIWGSVGLVLDQFPFCDGDHLAVLWLGTSPAYRQVLESKRPSKEYVGVAKRLVMFSKWAADSMGVPLFVKLLTLKELDKKLMSYTREMRQVGAMFGHGMQENSNRQYFDQKPVVPLYAAAMAYQHDAGFK